MDSVLNSASRHDASVLAINPFHEGIFEGHMTADVILISLIFWGIF